MGFSCGADLYASIFHIRISTGLLVQSALPIMVRGDERRVGGEAMIFMHQFQRLSCCKRKPLGGRTKPGGHAESCRLAVRNSFFESVRPTITAFNLAIWR